MLSKCQNKRLDLYDLYVRDNTKLFLHIDYLFRKYSLSLSRYIEYKLAKY